MQDAVSQELLTSVEVARWLRITRGQVYRLRDRKAIPPPVRVGHTLRWRRTDIDDWMRSGCPSLLQARRTWWGGLADMRNRMDDEKAAAARPVTKCEQLLLFENERDEDPGANPTQVPPQPKGQADEQ